MKKNAIGIIGLVFVGISAWAGFPTNSVVITSDLQKVTGNFDSFSLVWPARQTESVTFQLQRNTAGYDYSGSLAGFKIVRLDASNSVTVFSTTNITISTSNLSFTILYTNVPSPGTYWAELFGWDTAATNSARALSQGRIYVTPSIY